MKRTATSTEPQVSHPSHRGDTLERYASDLHVGVRSSARADVNSLDHRLRCVALDSRQMSELILMLAKAWFASVLPIGQERVMANVAGGEKNRPVYDPEAAAGHLAGHVTVLTGCRKGTVPAALTGGGSGVDAAAGELDRLVAFCSTMTTWWWS
jgi:hypothetical protein